MKKKKKKMIMSCIEGMTCEKFSRDLYFGPGSLAVAGVTLKVSYENNRQGPASVGLSVITDNALADSREVMGTLFNYMSLAGKKDNAKWGFEEGMYECVFRIWGKSFNAIHDLLALAVNASRDAPGHCAEPLLHKMKEVAGAFAVDYKRFTGWREEAWKRI